jgi:hypothetical protein
MVVGCRSLGIGHQAADLALLSLSNIRTNPEHRQPPQDATLDIFT